MSKRAKDYVHLSPEEHVLHRPDTYVGGTAVSDGVCFVHDGETYSEKETRFSPGFMKTFDEIVTNVVDQAETSKGKVTKMDVTVKAQEITVRNTGSYVPVEKHESGDWCPTVCFFRMNSSENYDDEAGPRFVGGRNGVGAKATIIFSKECTVEVCDPRKKKLFQQTCRNNMREIDPAKITALESKPEAGHVEIRWKPDFPRFSGMKDCNEAMDLLRARVVECACVMGGKCAVTFNGKPVQSSLEALVRTQVPPDTVLHTDVIKVASRVRAEIFVGFSDTYKSLGWVNGVRCATGTHIDAVVSQVSKAVVKLASKKRKEAIPERLVRSRLFVAVRALVDSPVFSSQMKDRLATPASALGYPTALNASKLEKGLAGTPVVDAVLDLSKFKDQQSLKRAAASSRSSRGRPKDVPKLEDARDAGQRNKHCTLIVTEGDSAKSLAVAGLSVVGRERFGVFPLKGKPLNVMNAGLRKVQQNAECLNILKILGAQPDAKLTDPEQLRYQRVLVFSDQDLDGYHITALLTNMLTEFFPALVKACPQFVQRFATPLIVAKRGEDRHNFYNVQEFDTWCESNDPTRFDVRYLKGLGSSTVADAKRYFADLQRNSVFLTYDGEEDREAMRLAFDQTQADARKEWLQTYDADAVLDYRLESVPVQDYVHRELKHFSMADNVRAIPNLADGLKPSQRKVLWGCFERNVRRNTKVSELAANVAGDAQYHHGSVSLEQTIVCMAQNYPGANNWPLLHPEGQFGTAVNHKAAASRYIFTRLDERADRLFRGEDAHVLTYQQDEGKRIEPRCFWPVAPLVLLNGAAGIGTGYSTSVPPVNPEVLCSYIRASLEGSDRPKLEPWWRDFNGKVTSVEEGKYSVSGVINRSVSTVEVTELPPGRSSDWFQELLLQKCVIGHAENPRDDVTFVKSFENHSTVERSRFVLTCDRTLLEKLDDDAVMKALKLVDTVSLANMHLFDADGRTIRRFDTLESIADAWIQQREPVYAARLAHQIEDLSERVLPALSARAEWIRLIVNGEIDLRKKTKAWAEREIERRQLGNPDPLLGMSLLSMTQERYEAILAEHRRKSEELQALEATDPRDIWLAELEEVQSAWKDWNETVVAEEETTTTNNKRKGGGKKEAGTKRRKKN